MKILSDKEFGSTLQDLINNAVAWIKTGDVLHRAYMTGFRTALESDRSELRAEVSRLTEQNAKMEKVVEAAMEALTYYGDARCWEQINSVPSPTTQYANQTLGSLKTELAELKPKGDAA